MKKLRPPKRKNVALLTFALLVLIAGVIAWFLLRDKKSDSPTEVTYSTSEPDESKERAHNYNWQGAPDEPKKLRISSIGVDAYVQKTGVDQDNKVAVPTNVHLAGWFANSQKPGQNGLSIIDGHVSGRINGGVFKSLKNLKQGDEFEIELGNGDIKHYKVITTKQIKESESANYLFSQNPKVKSQVNLITCGGEFNSSNNQFDDRIIVSGELQP